MDIDVELQHTAAGQVGSQDDSYRKLIPMYSQMRINWEMLVQFNHHKGDLKIH